MVYCFADLLMWSVYFEIGYWLPMFKFRNLVAIHSSKGFSCPMSEKAMWSVCFCNGFRFPLSDFGEVVTMFLPMSAPFGIWGCGLLLCRFVDVVYLF